MGWFSKKKVVTTGVARSSFFDEDEEIEDPILTAARNAMVTGSDIVDNINAVIVAALASKADSYYNVVENGTELLLPTYSYVTNSSERSAEEDTIASVIEAEIGEAITIINTYLGAPTELFQARVIAQDSYNWDSVTNIIADWADSNTYYLASGIIEELEPLHNVTEVTIKVIGSNKADLTTHDKTMSIPTYSNFPETVHYEVGYTKDAEGTGKLYFWTNKASDTSIPEIAPKPAELVTVESTVFPYVPIRENGTSIRDYADQSLYTEARLALNMLDLDIDTLTDGLEENSDIDSIDDAFIGFSLDIMAKEQSCKKYLYKFFEKMALTATYTTRDAWKDTLDSGSAAGYNHYEIKDGEYNITLISNYIETTIVAGSIGDIGTATTKIDQKADYVRSVSIAVDFDETYYVNQDTLTLRIQITDATYSQIVVSGLIHDTNIRDSIKDPVLLLRTVFDTDNYDGGFYIPIDSEIINTLDFGEAEVVMYRALSLTVFAIKVSYVKWYKTEKFLKFLKAVLLIVAVVVAIYTGIDIYTAFAASGFFAAAAVLAVKLVIALAIRLVVGVLIDIFGAEEVFIVIIIAAIAAAVAGFDSGIELSFPSVTAYLEAVTVTYLSVVSTAADAIVEYAADELESISREYEVLEAEYAALEEEIEEAEDLMGLNIDSRKAMELTVLMMTVAMEPPSDFYDRTIHYGNIGVRVLDDISSYVDEALKLPTQIDLFNI